MQVTFLPTGETVVKLSGALARQVQSDPKPLPRYLSIAVIAIQTLALFKLTTRDPLATDLGIQATFEVACAGLSLFLAVWTQLLSKRRIPIKPQYWILALVYLICLASSANSFYPVLSAAKALLYLANLCTIILASRQLGADRTLNVIYWTLFSVITLGLCIGLYRPDIYPLFLGEYGNWRSRLAVLALHPGLLAEMAGIALLIGASPRTSKHWATQLFFATVLLLTVARTSIVVALAIFGIAIVKNHTAAARRAIVGLSYCFVFALIAAVLITLQGDLIQPILGYMDSVYLRTVNDSTLSGRSFLWAPAMDILLNSWAFGYGVGGARGQLLSTVAWAGEAHNSYLDIGLACGFIGGILFLLAWFLVVRQGLRDFGRNYFYRLLIHLFLFSVSWVGALMSLGSTIGILILIVLASEEPEANYAHIIKRAEAALRAAGLKS
ncbi:O-antigen ligase family protein [Paludibaculum fermentans]|uniref:O-antigen ligase family protein n=1 Tax=Paludibaculum fermentans TaxID=1473598 RepID=UPI003EBD530A